jgi:hypothetical protein
MHNLLLFKTDERPFPIPEIERIFRTAAGFREIRFNEPGGHLIEADYVEPNDWTIVGLSGDGETISLSGTSDAAFHAALILQRSLGTPLRMIDTEYSFDLTFQNISTVDELRTAMEKARTY